MRKEHDQTLLDIPLGFSCSNHCVNDDLCAISEVSELRLPDGECVRVGLGVTVLEAEDSILRQVGVADLETLDLRVGDHSLHGDVGSVTLLVKDY